MSVCPEDSKKGKKEDESELERKREELYEDRKGVRRNKRNSKDT